MISLKRFSMTAFTSPVRDKSLPCAVLIYLQLKYESNADDTGPSGFTKAGTTGKTNNSIYITYIIAAELLHEIQLHVRDHVLVSGALPHYLKLLPSSPRSFRLQLRREKDRSGCKLEHKGSPEIAAPAF
ncbi:hypothetical protein EMPG_11430 [Blastomyces silverae]|uniref:Uncharacterized protein n=1 Tax=Blastomyces silverae TaxID=2060906 RepID=A0A0H1BRB3_9EURO|nr:hypothetical protein EMPG_11430 [Blastomyces silverae]